jgi:hypothetical protein
MTVSVSTASAVTDWHTSPVAHHLIDIEPALQQLAPMCAGGFVDFVGLGVPPAASSLPSCTRNSGTP